MSRPHAIQLLTSINVERNYSVFAHVSFNARQVIAGTATITRGQLEEFIAICGSGPAPLVGSITDGRNAGPAPAYPTFGLSLDPALVAAARAEVG